MVERIETARMTIGQKQKIKLMNNERKDTEKIKQN